MDTTSSLFLASSDTNLSISFIESINVSQNSVTASTRPEISVHSVAVFPFPFESSSTA